MRWLWSVLVLSTIALVGCGGSGEAGSNFGDDDGGGDATTPYQPPPGNLFGDSGQSDSGPKCSPRTCAEAGANCGPVADGCGKTIECGPCTAPATCGGGGTASVCGGTAACVPATCATLNVNCGQQGDGCGAVINCGDCTVPQTCGGGGTGSVCGGVAGCVPLTACPAGQNCGAVADGCGNLVQCGTGSCPTGEVCGGGGQPNTCGGKNILPDGGIIDGGVNQCTPIPKATACSGKNCGIEADGCGNTYDCGTCTAPQTCGGGGTASVCGGNSGCVPVTKCPAGMNCGVVANGCGGTVSCGTTCPSTQTCGGGGQANVCGAVGTLPDGGIVDGGLTICTPIPKATACGGKNCGAEADGCGNTYDCGTCTAPQTCGGGGTASVCGGNSGCVPVTKCPAGMNCGVVANGCGGTVSCGTTCPSTQTCGGGGQANVCGALGTLSDGGVVDGGLNQCTPTPKATACQGIGCGLQGDGCGNTYNCGTCTGQDSCGGGGTPFQCGHPSCTPATTCPSNIKCGTAADGCGGTITCGTCSGVDTCGGGGTAYVCGHPACTPATTCPANVNCGPWPDGCGGKILSCGTCTAPAICGGSGVASQCGDGTDGGILCTNLQCNQVKCDGGATTSISGKVYDPAGKNPIYNVVVYVPNSPNGKLDPLPHGPSCDTCGSLYSGSPLVATTTGTDGSFTLTNVPVMTSMPLVIQIGKWRRQLKITGIKACQDNPQTDKSLKLPGAQTTTDDLPEIAISTGSADSMECLFERIGVSTAEYSSGAGGATHLHIFQGSRSNNARKAARFASGNPSSYGSLFDKYDDLTPYDIVILSCEGQETQSIGGTALTTTQLDALHSYATNGGRVFASHYHYAWFNHGQYNSENLATWTAGANAMQDLSGNSFINTDITQTLADGGAFARGKAMFSWLGNVSALGTNGAGANQLNIHDPKHNADVAAANTPSQTWLVADQNNTNPGATEYFSFDTPTGGTGDAAAPYCGRVVYSDLHVGSASGDYPGFGNNTQPTVPGDCATADLSAQEKALEFMLFDLSSCVSSDSNLPVPDPKCTKITKCPANITCGTWPDGCGGSLDCGTCSTGTCVNGTCNTSCTKLSCSDQGLTCGAAGDGCGGTIAGGCGTCAAGQSCINGTCTGTSCTKVTCAQLGLHCGTAGDGCGGTQNCGNCTPPQTCGGGGVNGVCGQSDANLCVPLTCNGQNIHCGPAGDGCGGVLDCGPCTAPQTCGGGGTPGVCGAPSCTPIDCAAQGLHCGPTGDGCGHLINCGTCTPPLTCGGGGTPGTCGQSDANACKPLTCAGQNLHCGPAGDGCGGLLDCGPCTAPQTCGGGGTPGVCGAPTCTPLDCNALNLHCGKTGDGCGGILDCGVCVAPQTCGGGGTPGVCGAGDASICSPLTCNDLHLFCGQAGDGCGNLVNCGPCAPPQTCGGGGTPGVCGAPSCTPKTCTDLNANCGKVADGCGGLTASCGDCTTSQTCGGGGTANQCGAPNCTPRNCQQAGANCGPVADGCGSVIDCGSCASPQTCGGGGTPSVCGGGIK